MRITKDSQINFILKTCLFILKPCLFYSSSKIFVQHKKKFCQIISLNKENTFLGSFKCISRGKQAAIWKKSNSQGENLTFMFSNNEFYAQ